MVPYGPYGLKWSHMVLYGPMCSCMVPFGPLWSSSVPYGPYGWSPLIAYGPLRCVWSLMFLYGPKCSLIVLYVPVRSCLYGPVWSSMVHYSTIGFPMVPYGARCSFMALYGGNLLKTILWLLLGRISKIQQIRHVLVIKLSNFIPR